MRKVIELKTNKQETSGFQTVGISQGSQESQAPGISQGTKASQTKRTNIEDQDVQTDPMETASPSAISRKVLKNDKKAATK